MLAVWDARSAGCVAKFGPMTAALRNVTFAPAAVDLLAFAEDSQRFVDGRKAKHRSFVLVCSCWRQSCTPCSACVPSASLADATIAQLPGAFCIPCKYYSYNPVDRRLSSGGVPAGCSPWRRCWSLFVIC